MYNFHPVHFDKIWLLILKDRKTQLLFLFLLLNVNTEKQKKCPKGKIWASVVVDSAEKPDLDCLNFSLCKDL